MNKITFSSLYSESRIGPCMEEVNEIVSRRDSDSRGPEELGSEKEDTIDSHNLVISASLTYYFQRFSAKTGPYFLFIYLFCGTGD